MLRLIAGTPSTIYVHVQGSTDDPLLLGPVVEDVEPVADGAGVAAGVDRRRQRRAAQPVHPLLARRLVRAEEHAHRLISNIQRYPDICSIQNPVKPSKTQ